MLRKKRNQDFVVMDINTGGKRDLLENKFQILSNIHLGHRISVVFFYNPLTSMQLATSEM